MNPFTWFRNWRIRRLEEHIAYLEKYCDMFTPQEGPIPYQIALYHSLPEKRAKISELRKRVYHLMEF